MVGLTNERKGLSCVRLILCLAFCFGWQGTFLGHAQPQESLQRIEEIRIIGNRRVPESTIRYYIRSSPNGIYSKRQVYRDYWNLLDTNFFSEIEVRTLQGESGTIVIFEVEERPLIRAIEFRGLSPLTEQEMREWFQDTRVGLSIDAPLNKLKLPRARQALVQLLELSGQPKVQVEVEVEEITASSIRLIFHVEEGPKD